MGHDWVQPSPQGSPEAKTSIEKLNSSKSILSETIAISAVAIFCLCWEALYPSPATVLLLGLFAISYINYLIGGRDVLYPAFSFTAIWALVAAAYNFCPIEIDRLGWKTVAIFLAGGASFSIGSLFGNRPLIRTKFLDHRDLETTENRDNVQARNILLGFTFLVAILYLLIMVRGARARGMFFLNPLFLLMLNSGGDSPISIDNPFTRIIVVSGGLLPVLTLWVLLMEDKRKWAIALCAACAGLFPLFLTQRGLVMEAFCGCTTLLLLKSRDRSFRKMARPLSLAGLAIVVLMGLLSLTKSWHQRPGGYSVTDGVWMYMVGPLATFNFAVYHPEAFKGQPEAVFAQILTPLSSVGLVRYRTLLEVDGQSTDRFAFVPFPGNVYTAYKPYYQDFGAMGCFAAFTLFGFIEGYLFYAAIRGNRYAAFFLIYLSGPLMFSTFDDLYHGFSRHLNMAIFAIGYFGLLKRLRFRV
jgi:oligosaccharide repeat unit polymerase